MRARHVVLLLAALAAAGEASAAEPLVREARVAGPRVRLCDLVAISCDAGAGQVDFGPAPAVGGSRVIDREEIHRALKTAKMAEPTKLPSAIRVVRKTRKLGAADVEKMVREAVAAGSVPRGGTLASVKAAPQTEVPEGWDAVTAQLPPSPRRAGTFNGSAMIAFLHGGETLARVSVPIEMSYTADAALSDVTRGGELTLVLARGAVEVNAPAVAGADGDLGATIPVTIRSSGRVLRAKIVGKDRALAAEGG